MDCGRTAHVCDRKAAEAETRRTGSKLRIDDDLKTPNDQYFVITPQVIVMAGGNKQFMCGARGGWSDIYFRQPNDLVSAASPLTDATQLFACDLNPFSAAAG